MSCRLPTNTGGLFPRVRGNRVAYRGRGTVVGSIPAGAGEPGAPSPSTQKRTVYPRVCGGTSPACASDPQMSGLSPRVRGNRMKKDKAIERAGSIPAGAGEPMIRLRPDTAR